MSQVDSSVLLAAERVLQHYAIPAAQCTSIPGGLINLTLAVNTNDAQYVLQRLNPIFPAAINLNVELVTRHLAARGHTTPRLLATSQGEWWVTDETHCWRLLSFVPGACYATLPSLDHAHRAGQILGRFHAGVANLGEPLPYARAPVHEPVRHLRHLADALAAHPVHENYPEVARLAATIFNQLNALPDLGIQPPRLLHGDPKLSNLRFGATLEQSCMLDLDTITTATLAYELGDAFRSWCNPYPEDDLVADFDLMIFAAAIEGYAQACSATMAAQEINSIVDATEIIYLELAARFAADALNACYFGWDSTRFESRSAHNIRRATNQLKAAAALRAQRAEARRRVQAAFACAT